jgi:hypothetical protein
VAEQAAAHVGVELDAANAGRLAVGHAGDGAGDRWRDAAGATTGAASDLGGGDLRHAPIVRRDAPAAMNPARVARRGQPA